MQLVKRGAHHRGRKAQISMELLIVMGFATLLTVPLVLIFLQESSSSAEWVMQAQIDKIARKIVSAADTAYAFGEPTTVNLDVYLPKEVRSVHINDSQITFALSSGKTVTRLFAMNVTGAINATGGYRRISVKAVDGSVLITGH